MTVAVGGYSIRCAQGSQADGIYRHLFAPQPAARRALNFLGQALDLPYFAAFDEEILSLDTLCALLEQHALAALEHAGYAREGLGSMPIFLASTSFHVADCERQAEQNHAGASAMDYALHTIADYFSACYGNTQVFTCATSCTSAANALVYAKNFMDCGWCGHALVLAFESFNRLTLSNFQALGLLSKEAYRPLAGGGMILGEGVAAVVLEKKPPRARPFTLQGTAAMTDPNGLTSVSEAVLRRTLRAALADAGVSAAEVCAIKANASGGDNDTAEKGVLATLFPTVPVTVFKPLIGNTLGASALLEWVLLMICLQGGKLPGCLPAHGGHYLLHAFGFGGNSSALVMRYAP